MTNEEVNIQADRESAKFEHLLKLLFMQQRAKKKAGEPVDFEPPRIFSGEELKAMSAEERDQWSHYGNVEVRRLASLHIANVPKQDVPTPSDPKVVRAIELIRNVQPQKPDGESFSARTSAGCGFVVHRKSVRLNYCKCRRMQCQYEIVDLLDLFIHDFPEFLVERERILPSNFRLQQDREIKNTIEEARKLRSQASQLYNGIRDTFYEDVDDLNNIPQNGPYLDPVLDNATEATENETQQGDDALEEVVVVNNDTTVDNVASIEHTFDIQLISDVEEDGLTRKFTFRPNAEESHPIRVVYRNCRDGGSIGRNRKKKDNAASRFLISKLVDTGFIKFGFCNSQNTVNIHCCSLNFSCTGMAHIVRKDGARIKKSDFDDSGINVSNLEPEELDEVYEWRISLDKPQADVFVDSSMMIEIASKTGEPYFSCFFFVDPNSPSPIVTNWNNNMMNPEVEHLNPEERSAKRQRRAERKQERQANAQRNNNNPRWADEYL